VAYGKIPAEIQEDLMARTQFPIRLEQAYNIAPKVRHFIFVRADDEPFDFIAGQFVNLHFTVDDEALQRSYSIATPAHAGNQKIELAISFVEGGKASDFLFNLQPGETIAASGPFGRLILRDEQPKRYVLIATGTGVTPYRAMIPILEHRITNENLHVALVLGARTPQELLYQEEFAAIAAKHSSHFTFYGCCSRDHFEGVPYARQGRIQEILPELKLNPQNDIVFLCGNPFMIDDMLTRLLELGIDKQQIRREKYVFSH
jgi:ferredoxin-NADP reductase